MSTLVNTVLDFGGARRITNLANAVSNTEPVTLGQMNAYLEGVSWKDAVRAASTANINVASPGASIDGVTLSASDRVLLKDQSTASQNGIYIWNGAATPMTRALDASTFAELEAAVVLVEEGTGNGGTRWRQTQVNGTIDSSNVVWASDVSTAPPASETTAGIAELATQAEVDAGTDDARIVTSAKLANAANRAKRYSQTLGDGAATSIAITHNLGTEDVIVYVRETGGSKRQIFCEVQHTTTNSVTLLFDTAPALNSYRVTVVA